MITLLSRVGLSRATPLTLKTWLTLFAIGLILPTVIVAAILIGWNVMEARRSAEFALLADARAMAAAIDQDVARNMAFAEAIASSDALERRTWPQVRARIARLDLGAGAWVEVSDRTSDRLLDTEPLIAPPPAGAAARPRPANILRTLKDGRPLVSNLFTGAATQRAVVAIDAPSIGDPDELVVSVVLDPTRFQRIMTSQPLPARGFATLVGGDHRVIMRTRDGPRFQGARATASMVRAMETEDSGITFSRSLDGERTVVAYAPSAISDWTVMVVAPRAEFEAPIWRMVSIAFLIFLPLLVVSVQISRKLSKRIAGEIGALEQDAMTVSEGHVVASRPGRIADIDRVQSALSHASEELQVRAERQTLLINELNHRVKNTLATVQALAVQTFRGTDPARARAFEQRLVALGAAHDLLTQSVWSAIDIRAVVGRCNDQFDLRVIADGPSILLPPEAALALCMILHELQTNSLKYGSLSAQAGHVSLTWSQEGEIIVFHWQEGGGPPIANVERKGFGTRLIDRLVRTELNGTLERRFEPAGLRVTGRFRPLPGRWAAPFSHGVSAP